jgi:rhamnogalacturonyl hydrolase YesR
MSTQTGASLELPVVATEERRNLRPSLAQLRLWVEQREYAGWEPYDLLNSPLLASRMFARFPFNWLAIQAGKQIGSKALRRFLRVPASRNPKALALFISGYCDLARSGEDTRSQLSYLKKELERLRSSNEEEYCWGYDWPYVSLRGTRMLAFSPNAIATVACGEALLDLWQVYADADALEMAKSVGRFIVTRLNRPVDLPEHLCFSYTPSNHTRIYNSSALCCAFLARLGAVAGSQEHLAVVRRGMNYLASRQRKDGSWPYGEGRWQNWIDSFHTGFNLGALLAYELATGDSNFSIALHAGYRFYVQSFFRADGAPKYYAGSVYPIDIHSCSQALLVLSDFGGRDPEAEGLAGKVLAWTETNMRSPDGFFYYQRHRAWVNRVPYMRWGQAWMFRALAHLHYRNQS